MTNDNPAAPDILGLAKRCREASAQEIIDGVTTRQLIAECAEMLERMDSVINSVPEVITLNRTHATLVTLDQIAVGAEIMADRCKDFTAAKPALREYAAGLRQTATKLRANGFVAPPPEKPPPLVLVKG